MDKKIIILTRVSTSVQDLKGQTNDLIKEAVRLGYDTQHQIVIETVESGIKLSEEERLGLRKLKQYIESDAAIDCVICWEPSRLARQQKILYSIRDYLVNHKIQLYILNPYVKLLTDDRTKLDTTANIVFSLFATLSENEMSIKKERFARARQEMRQRGQKYGGRTLFGYKRNKEKYCVVDPITSKIVVEVYNHYVNTDDSLYESYVWLSGKYPELFPMLIYKKGQRKLKHFFEIDTYVKGDWCYDPIITQDLWDKAHEKLKKSVVAPRYNTKRKMLCRGKMYCGICGHMMTGAGGNSKAYMCNYKYLGHSLQINCDVADWLIWEETKTYANWNSLYSHDKEKIEMENNIKEKENLISEYKKTIEKIQKNKDKLLDIYLENRVTTEVFNQRTDDLTHDQQGYEDKISELKTEIASYKSILENGSKSITQLSALTVDEVSDFETKQEFVRKYIGKMIVNPTDDASVKKISFVPAIPLITPKNYYLYKLSGTKTKLLYRVNEDGTEDLIYQSRDIPKRDPKTGRFAQ